MRQLLRNFFSGWLAAQSFVLALLLLDIGGIGTLIGGSDQPLLPVGMLSLSLGALIGAASMATIAPSPRARRGGHRVAASALQSARIQAVRARYPHLRPQCRADGSGRADPDRRQAISTSHQWE